LCARAFIEGADMVAAVESIELERIKRAGAPQAERIDALGTPADDRRVIGDGEDDLARPPGMLHRTGLARRRLDAPAEPDFIGALLTLELPGVAVQQPVLRQLDLPSLHDLLAEEPVVVADAIAEGRYVQRGHALHEASRQPSQAAVAERRVGFESGNDVEVHI